MLEYLKKKKTKQQAFFMCAPGFPFCVKGGAVCLIASWPSLNSVRSKHWNSRAKTPSNLRGAGFLMSLVWSQRLLRALWRTAWTSPFPPYACFLWERRWCWRGPGTPSSVLSWYVTPPTDSSNYLDHGARKEGIDGGKHIPSNKPLCRLQWIKDS